MTVRRGMVNVSPELTVRANANSVSERKTAGGIENGMLADPQVVDGSVCVSPHECVVADEDRSGVPARLATYLDAILDDDVVSDPEFISIYLILSHQRLLSPVNLARRSVSVA